MAQEPLSTAPQPQRRRRLIFGAIALLVVIAASVIWWVPRGSDAPQASESEGEEEKPETSDVLTLDAETLERIRLETEPADLRRVGAPIRIAGVVGPDETRLAHIRSLSTGVITAVTVRRGDRVRAGQALLTYDNVELGQTIAAYRAAVASLETARSQAELARLAVERSARLVEIGGIPQGEHQRRQTEYAAAQASVRSAQGQLANFRQGLARFGVRESALRDGSSVDARSTLRAPFAGVVLDVRAVAGETVSPERDLVTVADLSTVWIQGDVYERDLAAVTEGRNATFVTDAYPEVPFECRVTYISQTLDPQTRTAKLRCEARNPGGRLRLEMFARMEIPSASEREMLVIPREAIQQVDGRTSVFVRTSDTRFERRTIALGVTAADWAEVRSGLQRGDRVVTTGAVMLKSRLKASELADDDDDKE